MALSPPPFKTDFLDRDRDGKLTGKVSWAWLKWLLELAGLTPEDPNDLIAFSIQETSPGDLQAEIENRSLLAAVGDPPSISDSQITELALRAALAIADSPRPPGSGEATWSADFYGQTGDLGPTVLFVAPVTGLYRIATYINCSTAGAGTVDSNLDWEDLAGAKTTPAAGTVDLSNTANFASQEVIIYAEGGTDVTYDTVTAGIVAAAYDFHIAASPVLPA